MLQYFSKAKEFYKQVIEEGRKIVWISRSQTIYLGIIVIISIVVLSLFSSVTDYFISKIIYFLLKLPLF